MPWHQTAHSGGRRRTASVPDTKQQSWDEKLDNKALNDTLRAKTRMIDWIYALRITLVAPLACFLIVLLFGVAADSIAPNYAKIIAPWISLPLVLAIILAGPLGF